MSYFSSFARFTQDRKGPFDVEFERLSKLQGWGMRRMGKERIKALRSELQDHAFRYHTGDKLADWQALCQEVGIQVPNSIAQCKKVSINMS